MSSKLSRSLSISLRGDQVGVKTPLLVPSFSSKALDNVASTFKTLQPHITDSFLVSAYDIHHHKLEVPSGAAAEVLFLDSGGYEVLMELESGEPIYGHQAESECWTFNDYRMVAKQLDTMIPTFLTSFDLPHERKPLEDQIQQALNFFREVPQFGREILIKPGPNDRDLLDINQVVSQIHRFNEFDMIGVTEAELGNSMMSRMEKIARLRQSMDSNDVIRPLHIYGSLDPVCTPLYFLAGADVFDGLSWLRFAYANDLAIYHNNRIPLEFGPEEGKDRGITRSYTENLYYLAQTLTIRLKRYLIDRDIKRLETHSDFFQEALDNLRVRVPEGVV